MAVKKRDSDREMALAGSAWDWWKDTTKNKGFVLALNVEATGQKGVFAYTMAATYVGGPGNDRMIAKVTRMWPNASNQCYGAFFLALTMTVGQIVDNWLLDLPSEGRTP